jgi:hypothetical protein
MIIEFLFHLAVYLLVGGSVAALAYVIVMSVLFLVLGLAMGFGPSTSTDWNARGAT